MLLAKERYLIWILPILILLSFYQLEVFPLKDFNFFISVNLNGPRLFLCWVVGILLSLSGCLLQVATRNPLGSPDILGINSGGSLGAVITLLLWPSFPLWALPFSAILGAIVNGIVLTGAFKYIKSHYSQTLVGVALHILCSSIIYFVLEFNNLEVQTALTWMSGSFWAKSWDQIIWSGPLTILLGISTFFFSNEFNLLALPPSKVNSLGVSYNKIQILALLLSTLAASIAVSLVGPIGFVALLAPHFAKFFFGSDFNFYFPTSCLFGVFILLLSDLISQNLFSPLEIPVGIVTAILGTPFFLISLLLNSRQNLGQSNDSCK